jgi:IPTL-CTERM motif
MRIGLSIALLFALSGVAVRADEVLFAYEGDAVPSGPPTDTFLVEPCDSGCVASIEGGKLVLRWESDGDFFVFRRFIAQNTPPPATLWVEWRFWSNQPGGGRVFAGDGALTVFYRKVVEVLNFFGDTVLSQDGGTALRNLPFEYRTFRFESRDGDNFCFYVDGAAFLCRADGHPDSDVHAIDMLGDPEVMLPAVNKWDFMRYGTISDGEVLIASDPPAGDVDLSDYPSFDRFTITFDQPAYILVDQVSVSVTGGIAPVVTKTRRLDNGPTDVVEIVLDRPIPFGETTTFTFDDGVATSAVSYTYLSLGACCFDNAQCEQLEESLCGSRGGAFLRFASCQPARGCCFDTSNCLNLAPACCGPRGGSTAAVGVLCDGDADGDGLDAACGDDCPNDRFNTELGTCLDVFFPIPAVSEWGLLVLALLLLVCAKVGGIRQRSPA